MNQSDVKSVCPRNKEEWRLWLEENHRIEQAVWLILFKKSTDTPTITWSEAVDEALCFGWIDSVRRPIDSEKFKQYFGRRKTTSTWSKINKHKVAQLIEEGKMRQAGHESIEKAKLNGSWNVLDDAENLKIPNDLEMALKASPQSLDFFLGLSKSVQKRLLHWIVLAKQPKTRESRVKEIAEHARIGQRPKQFR